MRPCRKPGRPKSRRGFTVPEIMVGGVLMMTAAGIVGPLFVAANQATKKMERWRLASEELSNQMERLSILDEDSLALHLKDLEISEAMQETLRGFFIDGEFINRGSLQCIRLVIHRSDSKEGRKLEMIGWIDRREENAE